VAGRWRNGRGRPTVTPGLRREQTDPCITIHRAIISRRGRPRGSTPPGAPSKLLARTRRACLAWRPAWEAHGSGRVAAGLHQAPGRAPPSSPNRQQAADCRFDRTGALTPGCCLRRQRRSARPVARGPAADSCRLLQRRAHPAAWPSRGERWFSSEAVVAARWQTPGNRAQRNSHMDRSTRPSSFSAGP